MNQPTPSVFTVAFGRIARTLDYTDQLGQLVFTFDLSGKGPKSFYLEHWPDQSQTDARYNLAYERTMAFLESRGYEVDEFGA